MVTCRCRGRVATSPTCEVASFPCEAATCPCEAETGLVQADCDLVSDLVEARTDDLAEVERSLVEAGTALVEAATDLAEAGPDLAEVETGLVEVATDAAHLGTDYVEAVTGHAEVVFSLCEVVFCLVEVGGTCPCEAVVSDPEVVTCGAGSSVGFGSSAGCAPHLGALDLLSSALRTFCILRCEQNCENYTRRTPNLLVVTEVLSIWVDRLCRCLHPCEVYSLSGCAIDPQPPTT